ncbi:EIF2B-alpha protein [Operophtera brumata]|uniref:Translation initiation factor eIF2B subunit alpha n=1 Tax=Operophtera brumata TaxID=104452 RepID=A0A0L7KWX7_OPEBR|nr:EIF2B-alpha protein [Operophtera brumata]
MKKEGKCFDNWPRNKVFPSRILYQYLSYFAEIQDIFLKILKEEEDISVGVAAIKTLLAVIEQYKVRELHLNLQLAVDVMRNCDQPVTAINSCCELFMRFITYTKLDEKSFEDTKQIMLQRGRTFLDRLLQSRAKIAKAALPFVRDGCKILTHSKSRVVLQAMLEAAKNNKRFQIGTYSLAMAALELKKTVYVLTESFKFSRIFPLNQQDLPKEFKYLSSALKSGKDLSKLHPLVDYTPPHFIALLFTDIGVLTPSAVSDELMKLYT